MKELVRWCFVHAMHWAVLFGAFALQLDGAMYLLKFWVWVMAPLSLCLLVDQVIQATAKKPPQPVRRWFSTLQAWVTLGLLVWFGHIASALAWGFVMLVTVAHRGAVRKARAMQAGEAAA